MRMKTMAVEGVQDLHARPYARRAQTNTGEKQISLIRNLIWLYIILWLGEGALRRWFLPGLAQPLLLVRDPVVLVIYYLASSNKLFPSNFFITSGILLAVLTFLNAMFLGHGSMFVALYGVRCDFLHVPLIFIMAKVLRRKDIIMLARVAVLMVIPYTLLLVAQFYEPQDAWVNKGVGDTTEGAGFAGALDRFRPPGTFSFITGPAELYPMITACWLVLLLADKLPIWLAIPSGCAILVAIPISISRSLFLGVAIVAIAGVVAMCVGGRFSVKLLFQFILAGGVLSWLALQSSAFKDGMEAFTARWQVATTDQGGFKEAIVDRVLGDLFGSFDSVRVSGLGTGFSTNVGQKLITTEVGFGASEGEWGRLLFDNGFILGGMVIIYRVALTCSVVFGSFRAWRRRSPYSLIFAASAFMLLFNGQWGQATTLGSAVIAGGLTLAAASHFEMSKPRKRVRRSPEAVPANAIAA
jgi:hypothetical protein